MNFIIKAISAWKMFLLNKNTCIEFTLTVIISLLSLIFFRFFLGFVENWDHTLGVFNDPFFSMEPKDLSIPIFLMMYGTIMFFIIYHLSNPVKLMYLIQLAIIILFFRTITLFLFRFDAPEMIILKDPFLNTFIYGMGEGGDLIHHDLFFSGHTANLFIASVLFNNKKIKYFFLIITLLMGSCLILQHVHYSIDVILAPLFSFLALFLHKKYNNYTEVALFMMTQIILILFITEMFPIIFL